MHEQSANPNIPLRRGDDTIKMYRYLEKLRVEAQQAGGDIRSHFGNHEVMNLIGESGNHFKLAHD